MKSNCSCIRLFLRRRLQSCSLSFRQDRDRSLSQGCPPLSSLRREVSPFSTLPFRQEKEWRHFPPSSIPSQCRKRNPSLKQAVPRHLTTSIRRQKRRRQKGEESKEGGLFSTSVLQTDESVEVFFLIEGMDVVIAFPCPDKYNRKAQCLSYLHQGSALGG